MCGLRILLSSSVKMIQLPRLPYETIKISPSKSNLKGTTHAKGNINYFIFNLLLWYACHFFSHSCRSCYNNHLTCPRITGGHSCDINIDCWPLLLGICYCFLKSLCSTEFGCGYLSCIVSHYNNKDIPYTGLPFNMLQTQLYIIMTNLNRVYSYIKFSVLFKCFNLLALLCTNFTPTGRRGVETDFLIIMIFPYIIYFDFNFIIDCPSGCYNFSTLIAQNQVLTYNPIVMYIIYVYSTILVKRINYPNYKIQYK